MTEDLSRREIFVFMAALAATACTTPAPLVWPVTGPLTGTPLVDVHCHLFNGSDLPAATFIKDTRLSGAPPIGKENYLDFNDNSLLAAFVQLFLDLVGDNRAPTATEEMAVIGSG